jgi:hypothetical protein
VGPIGSAWITFVKFVLAFGFIAWPAVVIGDNLRGAMAWGLGVPAELLWLLFVVFLWVVLRGQRLH